MDIGTFLLMQSPSGRPSQEIFARGIEQAQAAEDLGYRNVWLGEHHFSTYGYLSRPCQLATYIAIFHGIQRSGQRIQHRHACLQHQRQRFKKIAQISADKY